MGESENPKIMPCISNKCRTSHHVGTLLRCSVVTSSWTGVDLKPGHLSCQDAVPSWQTRIFIFWMHCRPCLYDVERMFYFQNIFCLLKTRRDHSSVVWVAKCKSSNLRFFGCQKKINPIRMMVTIPFLSRWTCETFSNPGEMLLQNHHRTTKQQHNRGKKKRHIWNKSICSYWFDILPYPTPYLLYMFEADHCELTCVRKPSMVSFQMMKYISCHDVLTCRRVNIFCNFAWTSWHVSEHLFCVLLEIQPKFANAEGANVLVSTLPKSRSSNMPVNNELSCSPMMIRKIVQNKSARISWNLHFVWNAHFALTNYHICGLEVRITSLFSGTTFNPTAKRCSHEAQWRRKHFVHPFLRLCFH